MLFLLTKREGVDNLQTLEIQIQIQIKIQIQIQFERNKAQSSSAVLFLLLKTEGGQFTDVGDRDGNLFGDAKTYLETKAVRFLFVIKEVFGNNHCELRYGAILLLALPVHYSRQFTDVGDRDGNLFGDAKTYLETRAAGFLLLIKGKTQVFGNNHLFGKAETYLEM